MPRGRFSSDLSPDKILLFDKICSGTVPRQTGEEDEVFNANGDPVLTLRVVDMVSG